MKQQLETVAKARQRSVSSLINGLLSSHLSQVEQEISTFTENTATRPSSRPEPAPPAPAAPDAEKTVRAPNS